MTKSQSFLQDRELWPDFSVSTLTLLFRVCQEVVETARPRWGPSSLFENSKKKRKKKKNTANTKHPKLYMYTILVWAGRRSGDNRISPGSLPWSHWLEITLWLGGQNYTIARCFSSVNWSGTDSLSEYGVYVPWWYLASGLWLQYSLQGFIKPCTAHMGESS